MQLLLAPLLLGLLVPAAAATYGGYSEDGTLWKCSSRNTTSSSASSASSSETGTGAGAAGHLGEITCSCDGMNMTSVPAVMPRMHRLIIENSLGMEILRKDALQPYYTSLSDVELRSLPNLEAIEEGVFSKLTKLRSIYILDVPKLKVIPPGVFQGLSPAFKVLRISRTGLTEVPYISSTGPDQILDQIDLESNEIQSVASQAVRVRANSLVLDYNVIEEVQFAAFNGSEIAELSFKGNRKLTRLSLGAFRGLSSLRKLDLSHTSITELPTEGLRHLEELRVEHTGTLTTIPSVYNFVRMVDNIMTACRDLEAGRVSPEVMAELLESVWGSRPRARLVRRSAGSGDGSGGGSGAGSGAGEEYAEDDAGLGWGDLYEERDPLDEWGADAGLGTSPPLHVFLSPEHGHGGAFGDLVDVEPGYASDQADLQERGRGGGGGGEHDDDAGGHNHGVFHDVATLPPRILQAMCGNVSKHVPSVECSPAPDALNPCEDIMGYPWLRGLVWLVVMCTVAGNVAVLAVLLAHAAALTVARFLMCHLAFADLCMGLYLLLLAAMDLRSHGEYFNYACAWQVERGCMVAGFLTIFSSQLSIYTLCVITLERWVAITYAIDLNKRLRLGAAAYIMAAGWVYAITMATLPLAGVSSYSSTSICLPMDSRDAPGMTYLVVLLLVAALAFVVVLACYIHLYLSLGHNTLHGRPPARPGQQPRARRGFGLCPAARPRAGPRRPSSGTDEGSNRRRKELSFANKMAILVLTDFTCWAPIAFFSMTALAGSPLISVTNSKILLVFFYPLNACANPFLYAITTSQYRRDLCMLLARLGLCTQLAHRYKLAYHSSPTSHNSNNQPMALSHRGAGCAGGGGLGFIGAGFAPDNTCYEGPGGPETVTSLLSATPPNCRTVNHHKEEAFV
ncbi:Thyrotropin receptor [Frankliniella fusca]|uniref:Thyrotropin receptor n=1 Tax=Frankliniella fusca TaxID=407009 RepID=A0AAE1L5R1_9NEOP|nr:Thyrotropin receptor [Frankliniella fusca]